MGQVLQQGSFTRLGTCWGGRSVEAETRIDNELGEVGGFLEGPELMDLRRGYGNLP